ncbi:hypothetical protein CDN99_06490 [Roseateles aquatilis]|uniref:PD-(D/E)XK endonuclease-like domain-containing protein n=1 Tax=Roseateles aquatilis TaxID=431061 RepID=A0A246JHH1_9BURK|nr:PD-(D/E)XK nuclease family protein [Roseateles aquatilis]OWQ92002.1 hypothetical protein CDN99_06490 [Roseateles aquatilis]
MIDHPVHIVPRAASQNVLKVRASSWGNLFDCAYAWEGVHILGYRKPAGLRAQLGTAVHASTAAFDRGRLVGAEPVSAMDAADVLVKELREPERDVDMNQDDLTVRDAERIGLALHAIYCSEISPRFNFTSVEQTLNPLQIDCGGGQIVELTGSMDRSRVANQLEGVVIPDVKTGTRVIVDGVAQTKGRSAQLGTYQLMYEHTERVPTVGAQILALATKGKPAGAISGIFDAKRVMVGTADQPGLIEIAAGMFRSGLFPPNPQSVLCSERYCARWSRCHFHE